MADAVYKVSEIVGTSSDSVTRAIEQAIYKAAETVRHIGWFEVTQIRGKISDGTIEEYQVTVKLGFRLED
jgi:flavin-binding protein dodecin